MGEEVTAEAATAEAAMADEATADAATVEAVEAPWDVAVRDKNKHHGG